MERFCPRLIFFTGVFIFTGGHFSHGVIIFEHHCKRRMESQRMMQNLINTIEYNHQNITSDPDRENTKQIFEEGKETERFGASIDRFIEIPSINQKTDYFRMNSNFPFLYIATKQTIEDNSINIEEEILR